MTESTSSIDEWRKSVDRTLKYYKEKIQTLKLNNKARLKKLQTQWQREKRALNNKVKVLQTQNEKLQESIEEQKHSFQQQIKSLKKKWRCSQHDNDGVDERKDEESDTVNESMSDAGHENNDSAGATQLQNYKIRIHKLFDYGANSGGGPLQSIDGDAAINMEHNAMKTATDSHTLRIQKWMKSTQLLRESYDDMQSKKERGGDMRTVLCQYNSYKQLMAEQEAKMEDLSNLVSDVIALKRQMKQCMERYEQAIPRKNELYKEAFVRYDKVREERKHVHHEMLECVDRLNEIIDEENKTNERKCRLYDEFNALRAQLRELKVQIGACSCLMKEYQRFDAVNEMAVGEMRQFFDREWRRFLQCWYEWDAKCIVIWLQYLVAENKLVLSKHVDLSEIEKALNKSTVKRSRLTFLDKNELKMLGFDNFNDRQQIYDKIQELIVAYPNLSSFHCSDEGKQCALDQMESAPDGERDIFMMNNGLQIPSQFLCPLTKQIMMEPVLIFDDCTYEKQAIVEYLKAHNNTSPMTNEKCDVDEEEIVLLPNRGLSAKIQTFLNVNPQICCLGIYTKQ
mmetsp:Transcript_2881/g.5374  ORF Transcript_2881/g.5374 Transcript_2881/m.5374 type:complete len:567 (-) Transcript_2881:112-1812(-)